MNILALETTERVGSVAAMSGGKLLFEMNLDPHKRSAQSLAPAIETLLKRVGWKPGDVDLVATTLGPGSFTGLRVGLATAKTFAYCVRADILGVGTLEVIAARAPHHVRMLQAAVDAGRGQVVARAFRRVSDGWLEAAGPERLIDVDIWLSGLAGGEFLTGPVLRKVADRAAGRVKMLDPECWAPSAAAVARLAARRYAAGVRHDLWSLVPRYSRPPAAEEKCQNRQI